MQLTIKGVKQELEDRIKQLEDKNCCQCKTEPTIQSEPLQENYNEKIIELQAIITNLTNQLFETKNILFEQIDLFNRHIKDLHIKK